MSKCFWWWKQKQLQRENVLARDDVTVKTILWIHKPNTRPDHKVSGLILTNSEGCFDATWFDITACRACFLDSEFGIVNFWVKYRGSKTQMLSKVDRNEYLPPNIYYINILLVTIQDPPYTPHHHPSPNPHLKGFLKPTYKSQFCRFSLLNMWTVKILLNILYYSRNF